MTIEPKLSLSILREKNLMLARTDISDGISLTVGINRSRALELRDLIDAWLAEPGTPKPDPEDYPADHPEHADNIGKAI